MIRKTLRKALRHLTILPKWELVVTTFPYRSGYGTLRIYRGRKIVMHHGLPWSHAIAIVRRHNDEN